MVHSKEKYRCILEQIKSPSEVMDNIRAFQLPQDLDIMLQLIDEGFQYPENPAWSFQEDERESMLDSLNGAKRVWPLIRVLQIFIPLLRDVMRGFIYEVDGKPVGLINFLRPRSVPEWHIGNVTVLPDYRRRGIARKLVLATLDELRRRQARIAKLEVVADNLPAHTLYKTLGFEEFSSASQYDFEKSDASEPGPVPSGYVLKPLRRADWQIQWSLMQRITPEEIAKYEPVQEGNFRPPAIGRVIGPIMEAVSGSSQARFGIFSENNEIMATGSYRYRRRTGGVNNAQLHLDPKYPDLADFTVKYLLSSIHQLSPDRRIEIDLKNWQPALVQAAKVAGCYERFRYRQMAIRLS